LDKKEWEAFLEKLSELEKKYQLVLRELDEAHTKLQALALDKSPSQEEKNPLKPTTPAEQKPIQRTMGPKKRGLLLALETKLQSLRLPPTAPAGRSPLNPNAPPNYASCSRCRRKIMHAARFCERCGADFGKWVCSCGHSLSEPLPPSVRFCDHCGRRVEGAI
jgi:hypothetical protein